MKWRDIKEDGRIVKGVNTTVDVGTDEIKKQAAKFGFKVDKDGRPQNHPTKIKGKSTNVLFNLGLAESKSYICPRTKASKCQCESVNSVSEALETVTAVCELYPNDNVEGTILFKQQPNKPTLIVGEIKGLSPGEHGFHIHEFGDLSKGCESAGGHYNPDGVDHGDLSKGHVGDLGNITADENGIAQISIAAERVDLLGERSVVGRSVVVHSDVDDLGNGGDDESLKTGNAGDRLACGVIVMKETISEGNLIPNPKNTFLTKADTAYDFIKLGQNMANLKSMPKGSNVDEPDIMVAPYAGAKEMKYLMKQLKRIGYDVQDAQGYQDAHYNDKPTGGQPPPQIKNYGPLGRIKLDKLKSVQCERQWHKLGRQLVRVLSDDYAPIQIDRKGRIVNGHHRYDALRLTGAEYARVYMADDILENMLDEGWSKKYKDSINCSNPKGFSQKAHCAGRKKK